MIDYHFHLDGPFKPYVRMTRRGKWVKPQAQEYLSSKDRLQWQLALRMAAEQWERIPRGIPLRISIWISPVDHRRDLDNEIKALLDAAQGIVFEDDRWVDDITAGRSGTGNGIQMSVGTMIEE